MQRPRFELLLEKLQIVSVHIRNSPVVKARVSPAQKLIPSVVIVFEPFAVSDAAAQTKRFISVCAVRKPTPPRACYPNNPGNRQSAEIPRWKDRQPPGQNRALIFLWRQAQRQLFRKSPPIRV